MTKLLNLPKVIVEDSRQTDETLILSVRAEVKTASCPHCGRSSHRLHQNHGHLVKALR
jgi:transposase